MLSPKESRELALKMKAYGNPDKDLLFNGEIDEEEYAKRRDNSLTRQLREYLLNNEVKKISDLPSKFKPIL
tara:strand:- start:267 stop:479 length:213 start_codon:yes stop_codon:yes gene_type:complete